MPGRPDGVPVALVVAVLAAGPGAVPVVARGAVPAAADAVLAAVPGAVPAALPGAVPAALPGVVLAAASAAVPAAGLVAARLAEVLAALPVAEPGAALAVEPAVEPPAVLDFAAPDVVRLAVPVRGVRPAEVPDGPAGVSDEPLQPGPDGFEQADQACSAQREASPEVWPAAYQDAPPAAAPAHLAAGLGYAFAGSAVKGARLLRPPPLADAAPERRWTAEPRGR